MAKWERDPVLRRRLSWLLAAAEVAAVTLNFYFVFAAYLRRVLVAVDPKLLSVEAFVAVTLVVTGLCLVAVAVQGFLYVRGRAWARSAFLVQNGVLIVLGFLWFVHSVLGRGEPDIFSTWGGLLLPLVTLFPLLWPLMSFRPVAPAARGG
jgi:hypothetical protein